MNSKLVTNMLVHLNMFQQVHLNMFQQVHLNMFQQVHLNMFQQVHLNMFALKWKLIKHCILVVVMMMMALLMFLLKLRFLSPNFMLQKNPTRSWIQVFRLEISCFCTICTKIVQNILLISLFELVL
uniref:Transmembrane protein n=1 Tax=Cacopsylla melanoneura TaxID=428564 RepID=A0A8D8UP55_9HEMI